MTYAKQSNPSVLQILTVTFFVIFLIIQASIPIFQLRLEGPARWGWQMYSIPQGLPMVTLQKTNSSSLEVDLAEHLVNLRVEILKPSIILPQFCDLYEDVNSVRYDDGTIDEVYLCH